MARDFFKSTFVHEHFRGIAETGVNRQGRASPSVPTNLGTSSAIAQKLMMPIILTLGGGPGMCYLHFRVCHTGQEQENRILRSINSKGSFAYLKMSNDFSGSCEARPTGKSTNPIEIITNNVANRRVKRECCLMRPPFCDGTKAEADYRGHHMMWTAGSRLTAHIIVFLRTVSSLFGWVG